MWWRIYCKILYLQVQLSLGEHSFCKITLKYKMLIKTETSQHERKVNKLTSQRACSHNEVFDNACINNKKRDFDFHSCIVSNSELNNYSSLFSPFIRREILLHITSRMHSHWLTPDNFANFCLLSIAKCLIIYATVNNWLAPRFVNLRICKNF